MLKVSAPGRICLFGEHQDYLNLPVIACAISLRISISGHRTPGNRIELHLPDLGTEEVFTLADSFPYVRERDYFRSAFNILRRQGVRFSDGITGTVRGEIPINAGTSSSSAMVVAWINFLAKMSDQCLTYAPEESARLAHQAEVLEFSEPGGMMDHYASALGGVLFLEFSPHVSAERIHAHIGTFVLGDSREPKDTVSILARVKHGLIEILKRERVRNPGFSFRELSDAQMQETEAHLSREEFNLLKGTRRNYQITLSARESMQQRELDPEHLGRLLNEHHAVLRDTLRISTPKIDRMIDAALAAGAYGAKINGSGGGGCMFAYAPANPQEVAAAIAEKGGITFIVEVDDGVRIEMNESRAKR